MKKPRATGGGEERRYRRLAARIAGTGLILQGTITARTLEPPAGESREDGKLYGPYYQWTFKVAGKTVTVNLTSAQAQLYQKAIGRNRELEETLKKMRKLSRDILEARTQGVKKRKSRKYQGKGLS